GEIPPQDGLPGAAGPVAVLFDRLPLGSRRFFRTGGVVASPPSSRESAFSSRSNTLMFEVKSRDGPSLAGWPVARPAASAAFLGSGFLARPAFLSRVASTSRRRSTTD